MTIDAPDLGRLYRDSPSRIAALVSALDEGHASAPVPACPGWSVADVVGHLTGVVEDVAAGRLAGPPPAEQTAEQVARHRDEPVAQVLATWASLAAEFEGLITAAEVWPAVMDVVAHEHDIRGALGIPGARDDEAVRRGATRLIGSLDPSSPLLVEVEDATFWLGPDAGAPLSLRTTRFEAIRWRLGRRSRAQLERLEWSGDPAAVLDQMSIFGPSPTDIVE